MPEPDNSNSNTPKKPIGSEIGVEKRLLLAFALMGAVLFITQYFYPQSSPQTTLKPEKQATPQQAKTPAPPPPTPPATPTPAAAGQVAGTKSELYTIETDVYKIVLSNHGAVVRSWELKQYRDGARKPLQLVNTVGASKTHYPFALLFENQAPSADLNQSLYVGKLTPDGLGIDFEFSNGRSMSRKSFRFLKNSYLSQVTSEVTENGTGLPHLLSWRGGFGDTTITGAAALRKDAAL